jgi:hypothetical protein
MSDEVFALYYKPDWSKDKLYFAYRSEYGSLVFTKNKYGAELYHIYGIRIAQDSLSKRLGVRLSVEEAYGDDE